MILWRSCNASLLGFFDGTGGMLAAGRWHSKGQAITYSSSAPSLTLLERLVHVDDPALLPPLAVVAYEVPDEIETEEVALSALPPDWRDDVALTRRLGDEWVRSKRTPLLRVPSAILPLPDVPDRNIIISHGHVDARRIRILRTHQPFAFDACLLHRLGPTDPHSIN
jgi:RES domain-containing protein